MDMEALKRQAAARALEQVREPSTGVLTRRVKAALAAPAAEYPSTSLARRCGPA
ncbi:hypothetical protein ES703_100415 [subsurface metagenome]